MSCWKLWKTEFKQLLSLSLFSVLTNGFEFGFIVVDMAMLGHLGKGNLAAGAIGMLIYNIAWYFLEGFLTAQDTLVSRAASARDQPNARYWSYVALITSSGLAVFFSMIFLFSPLIIPYGFYVNDHIASKASFHALILLPAFWCQLIFRVFQKYQQSQKIILPSLACSFVGMISNLIGNYVLMFASGIGFWGCSVSTTLSRLVMVVLLVRYVLSKEDMSVVTNEVLQIKRELFTSPETKQTGVDRRHTWNAVDDRILGREDEGQAEGEDGADGSTEGVELTTRRGGSGIVRRSSAVGRSRPDSSEEKSEDEEDEGRGDVSEQQQSSLLHPDSEVAGHRNKLFANIWKFCLLGFPGGLVMGLDFWSYELCAVFAAQLGSVALDTYIILVLTVTFFYLVFPFSVSVAATVRINKLLERNRFVDAGVVSRLSLLLGFAFTLLSTGGLYLFVEFVGAIYTNDQDIVGRLRSVTVFAVVFQACFGLQGSLLGPLRSSSFQWEILGFSFVSMWPVGLVLGVYLCFYTYPKLTLEGLWVGLMTGMALQCVGLLYLYCSVDWEKEAKRSAIRSGRAVKASQQGAEAAGATLNMMHSFDVGVPVVGSRAQGGFPTTFNTAQEDLDEFEIVEMGGPLSDSEGEEDENPKDRSQHMERGVEMTAMGR